MSFLSDIGKFFSGLFEGLFNKMKATYNKLPDDVKNSFIHGGGIVEILNAMIGMSVADIRASIQAKFPDVSETQLEEGLFAVAKGFGLNVGKNLDETIPAIQEHLKGLEGKLWAGASHFAASLLAAIFGPADTKFAAYATLMEWVYQHLIKGKLFGKEEVQSFIAPKQKFQIAA